MTPIDVPERFSLADLCCDRHPADATAIIEDRGARRHLRRAAPAVGGDRRRPRGARHRPRRPGRGDAAAGRALPGRAPRHPAARRDQRADRGRVRRGGAPLPGRRLRRRGLHRLRLRRRTRCSAAEPWSGAEEMHRDEPAFIFYTSGTTGTPKGAVLPQRVIHGHVPGFRTVFDDGPQPGDVFWTPSDWSWIGALGEVALPVAFHGYPLVATAERFSVAMAYRVLAEHGVTCPFLAPAVIRRMRAEPPPDPSRVPAARRDDRRRGARARGAGVHGGDVRLRAQRHLRPDRGQPPRGRLRGAVRHAAGRHRPSRAGAPGRDPRPPPAPSCRRAAPARSRWPPTTRS